MVFEDTPRLLKILVMVVDEGGRQFKCLGYCNFTIRSMLQECGRRLKYDDY